MTTSYLYDYVLSPFYDWLAPLLWPDWVHPNMITVIGGLFAVVSAFAMEHDYWGWACIFFTMYHMCDNMDGKHARRTGQTSRFGGILDHMIDGTMGNIAGYDAIAGLIFGVSSAPEDVLYWRGIHAYYCLWLAPHVVATFSGTLYLGSKIISIDECSLLATLMLFLAWLNSDSEEQYVLLPDQVLAGRILIVAQVLSISYATIGSAYHYWSPPPQPPTVWNHLGFMLYVQFWLSGILTPYSGFAFLYFRWIPVMSSIIILHEGS